jgi:hypothetical protein
MTAPFLYVTRVIAVISMRAGEGKHIPGMPSLLRIAAMAVRIGYALVYCDTPPWFHVVTILVNIVLQSRYSSSEEALC